VPEERQAILLAVLGTTPAILTEAFYFYARLSSPRTLFTEIHALTTKRGRDIAISTLLKGKQGDGSQFDRLLRRLRIPRSKVTFNENTLYVLNGREGQPLDDVRDSLDSTAVADQICEKVRELCSRKKTAVYATIAGGRKTMGVYLAMALQLHGRPQDRLFHILVDPRIENARTRKFFFPDRPLRIRGKTLRPEDVRIESDEIPILHYPWEASDKTRPLTFRELYERRQRELDWLYDPPRLVIDAERRAASIGGHDIDLDPVEFFYYYFFAELRREATAPFLPLKSLASFWCAVRQAYPAAAANPELGARDLELVRRLEVIFNAVIPRVRGREVSFRERMDRDLAPTGDYTFALNSTLAKIRGKIQKVVPLPLVDQYAIRKSTEYGRADYGIRLQREKIEILYPIARYAEQPQS
jgi:CRISPR-associated protein Csx14